MTSRARLRANARRDVKTRRRAELGQRVTRGAGATLTAGVALGASVFFAVPANAATFTVTNTNDAGAGSLRAAIGSANHTAGSVTDVITFAPSVTGAVVLTTGEIDIAGPVDIRGPGAGTLSIDAQNHSRIFHVQGVTDTEGTLHSADTTISGLTLTHGFNSDSGYFAGSAVYVGKSPGTNLMLSDDVVTANNSTIYGGSIAVVDSGAVTLTRVTVSDNRSDGTPGLLSLRSGAIEIVDSTISNNSGSLGGVAINAQDDESLTISGSTVSGNVGGVAYFYRFGGSGVEASSTPTTITGSTLAGNTTLSSRAGGLSVVGAPLTMTDSRVTGNRAVSYDDPGEGGGILLQDTPTATITGSLIDHNYVYGAGGGIAISNPTGVASRVTVTNSTVTDNTALVSGGGLDSGSSSATVVGSTITDNTAPTGGGVRTSPSGSTSLTDSVVAGNTHGDLSGAGFTTDFSLIQDPGTATYTVTTPGSDLIGADPLLGDLADNGGPTLTRLPAADSPVLDAGTSDGLTTDQRHLTRPVDIQTPNATTPGADAADMGAVELQGPPATPVAPITPALTPSTILGPPTRSTAPLCHGLPATIIGKPGEPIDGTPGPDVIIGTAGPDTIHARGGDDTICADAGNDHIHGGTGDDHIYGGSGSDTVFGDAGHDIIYGNDGRDHLDGGRGADRLHGKAGSDRLRGGPGNDTLHGGRGSDRDMS